MKRSIRLFAGALVPVFVLVGVLGQPAMAQDKAKEAIAAHAQPGKATQRILLDNDKVQAYELTFKPGEQGANIARPYRVIRALRGGTLLRTYADGKTEKLEWKTGEVRALEASPAYTPTNIGKTTLILYVVAFKQSQ
jgi:hypothetical protein